MGRKLISSSLLSLPGILMRTSFILSQLIGKISLFIEPLCIAVMNLGKIPNAFLYISSAIPFSLAVFLPQISIVINPISSAVLVGSCYCSLPRLRLKAFNLLRINVSSSVNQSNDHFVVAFLGASCELRIRCRQSIGLPKIRLLFPRCRFVV